MIRWWGLVALYVSTLVFSVSAQALTVQQHITKIDTTIGWIWYQGRTTTGNQSYFFGDQLGFYNANSTNGADRSFGYFLQYTYDMYCALKSKPMYCLGRGLVVNFSIASTSQSNKVMTIRVGGVTSTSKYFQEIRAKMFDGLERVGGAVSLAAADRLLIQPSPKRQVAASFKVVTSAAGAGNAVWKGSFPDDMLSTLNTRVGHIVDFYKLDRTMLASDYLFGLNQDQITNSYRGRGSSDRVTAIVSSPSARDSFGRAYIQQSSAPIFTISNCANFGVYGSKFAAGSPQDQNCTGVGIFLHELGHQMGLDHCASGGTKACTDNLATTTVGRSYLLNFLSSHGGAMRVAYEY